MTRLVLCLLAVGVIGCSLDRQEPDPGLQPIPVVQGLAGTVEFWEGDFMPSNDPYNPGGVITLVVRTVLIYEPTSNDDVVADSPGGFFSQINTKLVKSVTSNAQGSFLTDLPAGTYSVFVWEDGRFYANLWSGGLIQPVIVEPGEMSRMTIKIDYLATY